MKTNHSYKNPISYEYIHRPDSNYSDEAYAVYNPTQNVEMSYSISTSISSSSTNLQLPTALAVWTLSQNISNLNLTPSTTDAYFVTSASASGAQPLHTLPLFSTAHTWTGTQKFPFPSTIGGNSLSAAQIYSANVTGDFSTDIIGASSNYFQLRLVHMDVSNYLDYCYYYCPTLIAQCLDHYTGLSMDYGRHRIKVFAGVTGSNPSWVDNLTFLGYSQTWTALQNFTGGLQKNGSTVLAQSDISYNATTMTLTLF